MKQNIPTVLALGASLFLAGHLLGQNKAATPAQPPLKLVKIATLNTVQDNKDFANNVQLVQAQRQAAIELDAKWNAEKDAKKKAEIKKDLDVLMAKLNENNAQMSKIYGFSLTRNYTMEIEKSHIYMQVTEEEAARIEKAAKEAPKSGEKSDKGTKAGKK